MKSLIQNSLELGEKPQTTEASKYKKQFYEKGAETTTVFQPVVIVFSNRYYRIFSIKFQ